MKRKANKRLLFLHLAVTSVLVAYVAVSWFTQFDCLSKMLFGFSCPFCGMTTAWVEAFKLNFAAAFKAHPLFLFGPPFLFIAVHKKLFTGIREKTKNIILVLIAAAFFILWILTAVLNKIY